ncbi:MAG: hypothetical protein AAGK97_14505 [Bacteroidota bacterium]
MPLKICSDHHTKSLLQIFEDMEAYDKTKPLWKAKSQAMIDLILLIDKTFPDKDIWAYTSHYRLILVPEDRTFCKCTIIIESHGLPDYAINYSLPEDQSPWPYARMHGSAENIKEAIKYIEIAMLNSGGWK